MTAAGGEFVHRHHRFLVLASLRAGSPLHPGVAGVEAAARHRRDRGPPGQSPGSGPIGRTWWRYTRPIPVARAATRCWPRLMMRPRPAAAITRSAALAHRNGPGQIHVDVRLPGVQRHVHQRRVFGDPRVVTSTSNGPSCSKRPAQSARQPAASSVTSVGMATTSAPRLRNSSAASSSSAASRAPAPTWPLRAQSHARSRVQCRDSIPSRSRPCRPIRPSLPPHSRWFARIIGARLAPATTADLVLLGKLRWAGSSVGRAADF